VFGSKREHVFSVITIALALVGYYFQTINEEKTERSTFIEHLCNFKAGTLLDKRKFAFKFEFFAIDICNNQVLGVQCN
jgi:hypothetical protein